MGGSQHGQGEQAAGEALQQSLHQARALDETARGSHELQDLHLVAT